MRAPLRRSPCQLPVGLAFQRAEPSHQPMKAQSSPFQHSVIVIRTCFLGGSVWRKDGCLSRKIDHYMLYRPNWNLGCSRKRLPIKLKNRQWWEPGFYKMRFSAEFERGFPVHFKTHFRLLQPIIAVRPLSEL